MDTARIAGALSGAGLFAALGMGPAYVAIACLYLIATALTLCVVAPGKPHPAGEAGIELPRARRARPEGRPGVCLDHAADARGAVGRLPGQSHRLSADQRPAALHRARRSTAPTRPGSAISRRVLRSARWPARSR